MEPQEINVSDARDVKALEIFSYAYRWGEVLDSPLGGKAYRIESATQAGTFYHVDWTECECPDHRFRGNLCAHIRAVRLYVRTIRAQATRIRVKLERELREQGVIP